MCEKTFFKAFFSRWCCRGKRKSFNSFERGEKNRRKICLENPQKLCFLYKRGSCTWFSYLPICYRFCTLYFSVWYLPPQCHWILKIWRHLDCSPRIIFRFQLIYHCRREKKKFSHFTDSSVWKGMKGKGEKRTKRRREKKIRSHNSRKLKVTRKTFWYFLKCHNCNNFTHNYPKLKLHFPMINCTT